MYKPGIVQLKPSLLNDYQNHVRTNLGILSEKPVFFVFHGGSGTTVKDFHEAMMHGVVKVNVNADTQFALMTGIKDFMYNNKNVSISRETALARQNF